MNRRELLVLPFAPLARGAEGGVRFGLVTAIRHADKESTKTRFYRSAKGRVGEAVRVFDGFGADGGGGEGASGRDQRCV